MSQLRSSIMAMWFDDDGEWCEPEHLVWQVEAGSIHPYERILVVIADTPSMQVTVRHAIRLAALSRAEVDFLAVLNVPAAAGMPDMLAVTDDLITGLTERYQSLVDWAAHTAACAGVPCRRHIGWGHVAATILYLADATHCDLIVMGAPAQSGWRRLLQPCIAKRVVAQARQPVLVIKERGRPSATI
jgi:nucleotide-binding universal stress UspA family protein